MIFLRDVKFQRNAHTRMKTPNVKRPEIMSESDI